MSGTEQNGMGQAQEQTPGHVTKLKKKASWASGCVLLIPLKKTTFT